MPGIDGPLVMPAVEPPAEPARLPRVTLAILAYNRRDAVCDTLRKMLEDLDYPGELEPIVVDNASTDGTHELIAKEFPDVDVIRTERNLGASAWNRALAAGTGDWFLILDDDCYLE